VSEKRRELLAQGSLALRVEETGVASDHVGEGIGEHTEDPLYVGGVKGVAIFGLEGSDTLGVVHESTRRAQGYNGERKKRRRVWPYSECAQGASVSRTATPEMTSCFATRAAVTMRASLSCSSG